MIDLKRILVATDFEESSGQALKFAVDLAQKFGSALTLIHVYEVPDYVYFNGSLPAVTQWIAPIRAAATTQLEETLTRVRGLLPGATSLLRQGRPADEIVKAIDELHPDLVVVGTHGRRGVSHVFLGSVAERVVRTASTPVLTVRSSLADPPDR
jgi:nucleotide-binding universal stress UspA family protein